MLRAKVGEFITVIHLEELILLEEIILFKLYVTFHSERKGSSVPLRVRFSMHLQANPEFVFVLYGNLVGFWHR